MRYGTQPSSASYPPKDSSTSHPVFLSMISRWLPMQAAQSSSVRQWYNILNNELSAYDCVSQESDLQQLGQKQESVRTKVCLENQIFLPMVSILSSSCKFLTQGRIHGTHPTTSLDMQVEETSGEYKNQQVLKKDNMTHHLGSNYEDQPRTYDKVM